MRCALNEKKRTENGARMKEQAKETDVERLRRYQKEVFHLQNVMLAPPEGKLQGSFANTEDFRAIPLAFVMDACQVLQKYHWDNVFEERALGGRCGYPCCPRALVVSRKVGKYRVSLKKQQIYESEDEQRFCSVTCQKAARLCVANTSSNPPSMRPTLMHIFGTDVPCPFSNRADEPADDTSMALATMKPKQVWSKSLGEVIERFPIQASLATNPPKSQAPICEVESSATVALKQNTPLMTHKKDRAEKVAKKLSVEDIWGISDSESELEDDSSDEEINLNPADNLSVFINVWRLLSMWHTPQTRSLMASHKPSKSEAANCTDDATSNTFSPPVDSNHVRSLRYNMLCSSLSRTLPGVSRLFGLKFGSAELKKISNILKTFDIQQSVDTHMKKELKAIALVLLLTVMEPKSAQEELLLDESLLCEHCGIALAELRHLQEVLEFDEET